MATAYPPSDIRAYVQSPPAKNAPLLSGHTNLGFHPILEQNRFAVRGESMFALYPLSNITCRTHGLKSTRREKLTAHVARHLNLDAIQLIYVCDACDIENLVPVCYLDVKNMKKHFKDKHSDTVSDRQFPPKATAILETVCGSLIPVTEPVCNPALKFPLDSPGVDHIGKLYCNTKDVLGEGSRGTFVFRGLYENDDVAIRRIQTIITPANAVEEVTHLKKLSHENIVKYYVTERDKHFTYFPITLAEASLHDYMKQRAKYPEIVINDLKIFKDCCSGLSYLHNYSEILILHRDIKPRKILLTRMNCGESKAMLSDFGIAKKLLLDSTQTFSTGTKGTEGWIAPEVMNSGVHSRSSDVFSMGCVAFIIYSGGQHPFGDRNVRIENMRKAEQPNMRPIANVDIGIYSVIQLMLSNKPESRPPIIDVKMHPIFWTTTEKPGFLIAFCKGMKPNYSNCPIRRALEVDADLVLNGKNWKEDFSDSINNELENFRKKHPFDGYLLHDLVRAIRNRIGHFDDSTEELQTFFGGTEEKMVEFFCNRYPRLIHHCYVVAQTVKKAKKYYSGSGFEFPPLPKMLGLSAELTTLVSALTTDSLSHATKSLSLDEKSLDSQITGLKMTKKMRTESA